MESVKDERAMQWLRFIYPAVSRFGIRNLKLKRCICITGNIGTLLVASPAVNGSNELVGAARLD